MNEPASLPSREISLADRIMGVLWGLGHAHPLRHSPNLQDSQSALI